MCQHVLSMCKSIRTVLANPVLNLSQRRSTHTQKEGKEQQYPVLASISGSVDTSARRGRQILLAHNNWPLTPSDLEKLEEERKEHLSSYKGTEKPERVEPNWFGPLKKAAGPPSDPTPPQNNNNNSAASKPLLKRPTSVTFSQGVKESSTTDPLGTLASVSMRFAKEGGDNKPLTRRSLSDEAAELWTRQGNKTSNNNNNNDKNRLKESQADNIIKPPTTMQSAPGRRNSNGVENSFPEAGIMANRITVDTAGVPELNEGARPRGLKRPSLSRKVSFGKGVGGDIHTGLDPASPEDAMETDQNKRRRGSLSSEVSRALKRQRSYGEAQGADSGGRQRRPSPISQRKFSVDSAKFSFGDDFDFSVHGDRVPAALRREDRGFSIDSCLSLPPPAIFQRSDRQQSIDTFVSSKSVDSANQPQTPNTSGLTPSNIASPGLEPSSAEPMYDIYSHRYVDISSTKLPALPFQPGSLGDKSTAAMETEQARATAQTNQHPYPSTLNDEQSAAIKGAAAASMLTRPGGQRQQSLPASHPYHDYSPPQGLQPKSRMQSEPVIRIVSGTQQIQNRPSALQDAGLKQWLSGNSSDGVLPDPMQADSRDQMRPHHAASPYVQSPYGAYTAAQKAANRQVSCQSGEIQAPSPNHQTPVYRGQSFGRQNEKPQPVESMGTRQDPNTLERRHKLVEFGHPYPTVMEGRQLYSRHTLFMCGAHRSDIRLLNSDEEGCDSLLLNGAILLSRKEDLEMFKYRCSLRNGGAALLSNYKKRLPVRIFRQAKDEVSTGYRYDGLYSPIAMLDDSGKHQTKVATGTKVATFVFKRNPTGPRAKFSNRMMLEELLAIVQQANSNPGKNPRNDLQIPALTHSGGGSLPDYGRGNPRFPATHMRPDLRGHYPMPPVMDDGVNAAYSSAPPSASHGGKHHFGRGGGMGPHRSSLQRQTSAEVSLLRIRYFDDPTTTTTTTTARGNHHHHHHHHHPGEAAPGSGASTAAPMHAMYPMPPAMHPGMHGATMPAMRHGGVHHPQMHAQMQQPPTMPPHHAFFPNPNKTLHSHH